MVKSLKNLKRMSILCLALMMVLNTAVVGYAQEARNKLSAQLFWTNNLSGGWRSINDGAAFNINDFEPGSETVRYIKIDNNGDNAFSYELMLASVEIGVLAQFVDVYFAKEVTQNTQISQMGDKIGTLAEVINKTVLADGKIETAENGIVAIGLKMHNDVSSEYMGKATGEFSIKLDVQSADKFFVKFENTDKYLYRVGNKNTVALDSLFGVKDGADIGNVCATITSLDTATNVSGKFAANSDWTKSAIQFSGTGPVAVTVCDDKYANPLTLNLEVVDAKNITKAENATVNNVVLLNDISGTFSVSNGYTFYGNGFTVKLPTNAVSTGQGFVGYISIGSSQSGGVNGGNLDNVIIEGPVYPEMYIYSKDAIIGDTTDVDYGNGNNLRYFKNSVIVYGGNCTISNSYISGSRTALCLDGGNSVVIENTTLFGGTYANMEIRSGSYVTLRNLTTAQTNVKDSYGNEKTVHGLGIVVNSNIVDIYIEGELKQNNWVCEEQWKSIVPSSYQSSFPAFFTNSKYSGCWHYLNGGASPYVNMALIYACNWDTSKIHDNRTSVNYTTCSATIAGVAGGVYSKSNTIGGNAITDVDLADPGYNSSGFNPVSPVLNFDNSPNDDADDVNDSLDNYCVYDKGKGILKIGIKESSKTIDLSKVTVTKNGDPLTYKAYLNGGQISGNSVTIKTTDGAKQTLLFKATSNDAGYDKDGNIINGNLEYSWTIDVEIATLSYPAPVWNMGGNYKFDTSNCYYAYYGTNNGYGEAVPIYEGIKVNYYNRSGTLVELDLSGTTTLPTGSENSNSNPFVYTLADGSTLTMKYSSGWKSGGGGTHEFTCYGGKVYAYPQSLDNDNYIRAKTTNQDFDVRLTYTFTDPNGQSTNTVTMNWYNAKASNGSVSTVQWKTFDSINGKKPSCITPDTLVTLSNGSQKRVDEVTYTDELLVWNFFEGKYDTVTPAIIFDHGYGNNTVIKLKFEDGTEIKVVNLHQFFDVTSNSFVNVSSDTVEALVGHEFVKTNGKGYKSVKLVDYEITEEYIEAYGMISAKHYNIFVEGMLTTDFEMQDCGLFNYFEVGENLTFDKVKMDTDIEKYGLYTYEDFEDYITYEIFDAFNVQYMKVSVGKGQFTYEGIIGLIERWLGDSAKPTTTSENEETEPIVIPDENEPVALAEVTEEIETAVIELAGNIVTAASYGINLVQNGNILTLTATGNATTGYAIITLDGDPYYTNQIAQNETITVTVNHYDVAKNATVTAVGVWGALPENVTAVTDIIDLGTLSATNNGAIAILQNTTKYDIYGDVYMAVYSGNKLLDVSLSPNFLISGKKNTDYDSKLTIPEGATVRVFVWSPETMIPILK